MNEQNQNTPQDSLINLLLADGLESALPKIAEILMNTAMLLERERHIGAAPHQRNVERNGYGNGFKPRNFQTAFGSLELAMPHVRISDTPFCTSLLEKGSRSDGKRIILGVSTALSEAEVHWREFLNSLKERGIGIPDYIVSDAHTGLRAALKATLNTSIWQRCQFHIQQNAQDYITKQDLKKQIATDIATIFNADSLAEAEERLRRFIESYRDTQPKLADWAENNLPESFAVFALPREHRKKMRTSNACETLNSQIKRRTRVVGLFPNEDSLLRLVTGVIIEISDTWETGKTYLKPL